MTTISLQDATASLDEIVKGLKPGDEVVILDGDRAVAKVVSTLSKESRKEPRQLGTLRGTVVSMDGFDDPLDDFADYR